MASENMEKDRENFQSFPQETPHLLIEPLRQGRNFRIASLRPPTPYFRRSVEGEADMFEPHYLALPAFTVGVLLGVLLWADRIR